MGRKGARSRRSSLDQRLTRQGGKPNRRNEHEHRKELMAKRRRERHREDEGDDAEPHLGEHEER